MLLKNYKYAFIDESGNFGYDFDKQGTSTHFILTAIIIDQDNIEAINDIVKRIRDDYFGGTELKSSNLGHEADIKRIRILKELTHAEFYIMTYAIDKRKIFPETGFKYKESFIKYTNNLLHQSLKKHYNSLKIVSDEHGSKEFMEGFEKYFQSREYNLISTYDFCFENSKDSNLIQLADFICGTLAIGIDEKRKSDKYHVFMNFLRDKILSINHFPIEYESYLVDKDLIKSSFDSVIAEYCIKLAVDYLTKYKNSDDPETVDRVCIIDYLLFQLQTDKANRYVYSNQLKKHILSSTGRRYSNQQFMTKLIAKLRDEGVVLASSVEGYKIPLNQEEVYSYTNHTMQVIKPMLERLRRCRNNILIATNKELDILDINEYRDIKEFYDLIKNDKI